METEKKKSMSSTGKWALVFLFEILIAVGLGLGYFHFWLNHKLDKVHVVSINRENLAINEGGNAAQQDFTNIAIFGIDSRDTDSMLEGNRCDSIVVASINNSTKEVKFVSIYRDTLFHVDAAGGLATKLTYAYAYGGPELAIATLNHNLDLQITDFVTVNYLALSKAIDEIGGLNINVRPEELHILNICITEQINITGVYSDGVFNAGEQNLNGTQATAWTRIRDTDQGDITRTERQREVIAKMFEKLKASDAATINHILDEVFPSISTSMEKEAILELLKDASKYNLTEEVGFPFDYEMVSDEKRGSVLIPKDLTENVSKLHQTMFGTAAYQPSGEVKKISDELK